MPSDKIKRHLFICKKKNLFKVGRQPAAVSFEAVKTMTLRDCTVWKYLKGIFRTNIRIARVTAFIKAILSEITVNDCWFKKWREAEEV